MLFTVFAFAAFVTVFVHGINVRFQSLNLRIGIEPAPAAGNQRLLHKFDRADHVTALLFGQERMALAFEQSDIRVTSHHNVEIPIVADFFQEPHVTGVEPVKGAGRDDLLAL